MRKKIILMLLTLVTFTANAQRVEIINSEILHPEKRFELLDRTEITTGNLIPNTVILSLTGNLAQYPIKDFLVN